MFFTGLLLFLVFILNYFLIPTHGVVGAAISTGFAILVYNIARSIYIGYTYKLSPYKVEQYSIIIIFSSILLINYFIPEIQFKPFISILLKSFIFVILSVFLLIRFKINEDVTNFYNSILLKFKLNK